MVRRLLVILLMGFVLLGCVAELNYIDILNLMAEDMAREALGLPARGSGGAQAAGPTATATLAPATTRSSRSQRDVSASVKPGRGPRLVCPAWVSTQSEEIICNAHLDNRGEEVKYVLTVNGQSAGSGSTNAPSIPMYYPCGAPGSYVVTLVVTYPDGRSSSQSSTVTVYEADAYDDAATPTATPPSVAATPRPPTATPRAPTATLAARTAVPGSPTPTVDAPTPTPQCGGGDGLCLLDEEP